jgi:hypothetical protein
MIDNFTELHSWCVMVVWLSFGSDLMDNLANMIFPNKWTCLTLMWTMLWLSFIIDSLCLVYGTTSSFSSLTHDIDSKRKRIKEIFCHWIILYVTTWSAEPHSNHQRYSRLHKSNQGKFIFIVITSILSAQSFYIAHTTQDKQQQKNVLLTLLYSRKSFDDGDKTINSSTSFK